MVSVASSEAGWQPVLSEMQDLVMCGLHFVHPYKPL
jgi:hypothetical protein